MKTLIFIIFALSITSCVNQKRISKYPSEINKIIKVETYKKNNEIYVLERYDALVINKISILFMTKDSLFTIDKTYFFKKKKYLKNEFDEKLLLACSNQKIKIDTSNVINCFDCDYYEIYKISKSPLSGYFIDTVYRGNGIELRKLD